MTKNKSGLPSDCYQNPIHKALIREKYEKQLGEVFVDVDELGRSSRDLIEDYKATGGKFPVNSDHFIKLS